MQPPIDWQDDSRSRIYLNQYHAVQKQTCVGGGGQSHPLWGQAWVKVDQQGSTSQVIIFPPHTPPSSTLDQTLCSWHSPFAFVEDNSARFSHDRCESSSDGLTHVKRKSVTNPRWQSPRRTSAMLSKTSSPFHIRFYHPFPIWSDNCIACSRHVSSCEANHSPAKAAAPARGVWRRWAGEEARRSSLSHSPFAVKERGVAGSN